MAEFCTVEDVSTLLQIDIVEPVQVAAVLQAIKDASAAIQNYCRQIIVHVEDDEVELDGNGYQWMLLPELPVLSISEVIENGVTLVENVDYKLGNFGLLYRLKGVWLKGPRTIRLTYTHGYVTIPDDIVSICIRAAARTFQAGLVSADNEGLLGIASKQLGDFSVSFVTPGSSSDGGSVGVSGSRLLLMSEKDILDRYKMEEI